MKGWIGLTKNSMRWAWVTERAIVETKVPMLLIVEHRDDLARLDPVAFPRGDIADAAGGLGGDGGVVALDPTAHADDAWRKGGRGEAGLSRVR